MTRMIQLLAEIPNSKQTRKQNAVHVEIQCDNLNGRHTRGFFQTAGAGEGLSGTKYCARNDLDFNLSTCSLHFVSIEAGLHPSRRGQRFDQEV